MNTEEHARFWADIVKQYADIGLLRHQPSHQQIEAFAQRLRGSYPGEWGAHLKNEQSSVIAYFWDNMPDHPRPVYHPGRHKSGWRHSWNPDHNFLRSALAAVTNDIGDVLDPEIFRIGFQETSRELVDFWDDAECIDTKREKIEGVFHLTYPIPYGMVHATIPFISGLRDVPGPASVCNCILTAINHTHRIISMNQEDYYFAPIEPCREALRRGIIKDLYAGESGDIVPLDGTWISGSTTDRGSVDNRGITALPLRIIGQMQPQKDASSPR